MHTCFSQAAFLVLYFSISLKKCVQIDPNKGVQLPGLFQRGSECKTSTNQWKVSKLEHLGCNKQGVKREYSCPVNFDFNETFALCQNQNVRSIEDLNLPRNITVLCLGNTKLQQLESDAFANFSKIKHLDLSHNKQHLASIDKNAFRGLNDCVWIDLSHNNIRVIKPMTFSVLPNLFKLDFSYWRPLFPFFLDFQQKRLQLNCLEGLQNTQIQELNLNGINSESYTGILWEINNNTFKWLKDTQLKYLSLAENQIISVKAGVVINLSHLKGINISYNILSHVDIQLFLELYNMKKLLYFDYSNQNIVNFKYKSEKDYILQSGANENVKGNCSIVIGLPPNLQTIIGADGRLSIPNTFFDVSYLICLDDSNVTKVCLEHFEANGKLHLPLPAPNLKVLSVRGSKVKTSTSVLKRLVLLEYLDIYGFNKDFKQDLWHIILSNNTKLPNLRYLDMGNMGLKYICHQCLNKLKSLQQLYLDRNEIKVLSINITLLPNLEILNIANNYISSFRESNMIDLIKFETIKAKKNSTLEIDFTNNTGFLSSCDQAGTFIKLCELRHVKLMDNLCNKLLNQIKENCRPHYRSFILIYTIPILCVVAIICYKARYFLRFKCYSVKNIFMEHNSNVTHDAYFICSVSDIPKMQYLFRALENTFKYKLFIFERDTTGGYIMDALAEPFTVCSKIILVLSKNAIKGLYFKYLINLCKDYRDRHGLKLIVIFLGKTGQIRKRLQCKDLDYLLSTSHGISWYTGKLQQTKAFWQDICEFLGPPIIRDGQLVVLE